MIVSFRLNGQPKTVDVPGDMPLLWVLRDMLDMKGTKFGCGIAQCGACTVHINGTPTRSCNRPMSRVAGTDVTTIEGLSPDGSHPLQVAWQELDVPHDAFAEWDARRDRLPMLDYVPIVFISAVTKQRITKVIDQAILVDEQRRRRIPTSQLNDVMLAAIARHHPPTYRNQYVQIKFATQVREAPPVFAFFCNHPQGVKESYRRYLENQLREAFGFAGVPITLVFKAKSKSASTKE